jgi:hypothetical protein
LLLGAGAAFLWRPWTWPRAVDAPVGRLLDPLGAAALAALCCAFTVAVLTEPYVYQWLLPLVSVLSLVAVLVAVHPAAAGFRRIMSTVPLVVVGKRSYGLYLWSWPIFVFFDATHGSVMRFLVAMVISAAVAELSYRYIEMPVRRGAIGRWWGDRAPITYAPIVGGGLLLGSLVVFYVSVDRYDPFAGGGDATFELASDPAPGADGSGEPASGEVASSSSSSTESSTDSTSNSSSTPTTTASVLSADLAIVGDSQANALAINLPSGIDSAFPEVANGSVDGCGVQDSGSVESAVTFGNNFAICDGWQDEWADAASGADVALVVVGAWDLFDVVDGDERYTFGTAAGDRYFAAGLMSGIDAMLAEGANVGLLEIPCMRPVDVDGAGVRALPERGDDDRVAHLNGVVRWVASQYGPEVEVIDGPDEWCSDEAIATDLGYRWDGVHVYRPGAKLIMETVAPQLLQLAAV